MVHDRGVRRRLRKQQGTLREGKPCLRQGKSLQGEKKAEVRGDKWQIFLHFCSLFRFSFVSWIYPSRFLFYLSLFIIKIAIEYWTSSIVWHPTRHLTYWIVRANFAIVSLYSWEKEGSESNFQMIKYSSIRIQTSSFSANILSLIWKFVFSFTWRVWRNLYQSRWGYVVGKWSELYRSS